MNIISYSRHIQDKSYWDKCSQGEYKRRQTLVLWGQSHRTTKRNTTLYLVEGWQSYWWSAWYTRGQCKYYHSGECLHVICMYFKLFRLICTSSVLFLSWLSLLGFTIINLFSMAQFKCVVIEIASTNTKRLMHTSIILHIAFKRYWYDLN